MKRITDDLAAWTARQVHNTVPFPYTFPQIPPFFRHRCLFFKALTLLERGCMILLMLLISVTGIRMLIKIEISHRAEQNTLFFMVLSLALWGLFRLLRHTPKQFWHCPHCKTPFPYYAPPLRGTDELKEFDCLQELERLHIPYFRPKCCPLVIPSICPVCKAKFFKPKHISTVTAAKDKRAEN